MTHPFHYLQQAATRTSKRKVAIRMVPDRGGSVDAFGRLRISAPVSVWHHKNLYDRALDAWDEITAGDGDISHLPNEAAVKLSIGTADGARAVRQSGRYLSYVPGRSQFIHMTGVMAAGKTNLIQRIGYFDDNNGLFFEQDGTDVYVVLRSKVTGSVIDTRIHQTDAAKSTDGRSVWNQDLLNGNKGDENASHVTLDITKNNLFIVDFQWLSTGTVRFGFDFGAQNGITYCHNIINSNVLTTAFMSTPSLPLRYEIKNDGNTGSPSFLKEICTNVDSEGEHDVFISTYSMGNGIVKRDITERTPILAVRMVATFNGLTNHKAAQFLKAVLYVGGNNDVFFEIVQLLPDITDVGGDWVTTGVEDSGLEYNVGLTSLSSTHEEHIIDPAFVATGQGGSAKSSDIVAGLADEHEFISRNYDASDSRVFAIFATPFSGTGTVAGALKVGVTD